MKIGNCGNCAYWNESAKEPKKPRVGWCCLKDLYTFTKELQCCNEFVEGKKESDNDN